MSAFIQEPDMSCCESDKYFILDTALIYKSDILDCTVTVPIGFITDLASIPFGIKWAHREGILHDYLYRSDSIPVVNRKMADWVIKEAMQVKKKGWFTRWLIYSGVRIGGMFSYHKKMVDWKP